MKINGNPYQHDNAAAARHSAHVRGGATATVDAEATAAFAPRLPAVAAAKPTGPTTPAPVESTLDMASRKLPPGLVRVAARFEAMDLEGHTRGQSQAQTQVVRNLQRFAQAHSVDDATVAPLPDAGPALDPASGADPGQAQEAGQG